MLHGTSYCVPPQARRAIVLLTSACVQCERTISEPAIVQLTQGLKNHIAAGGLKKGATKHLSAKPPLETWTLLLHLFGSTCSSASARTCRFGGRLAAAAQRQSNNSGPEFTDEEVLTIYLFGLFKKRETVSDIHEYAKDHFSDWFPDLPSYQSYNRRLGWLSAVFAPLAREALSMIDSENTRGKALRIADSMPTCVAKGQRSSQAEVASDRLASVGYCSSKCVSFHGAGAPPCRRAQVRAASRSGAGWADAGKRKRPPRSSARVADHRGRSPLWRQGLLRRTAEKVSR